MNRHFLAISLWVIGGCFAATAGSVMRDGARRRDPGPAALACAVAVVMIAVLANAGADLW